MRIDIRRYKIKDSVDIVSYRYRILSISYLIDIVSILSITTLSEKAFYCTRKIIIDEVARRAAAKGLTEYEVAKQMDREKVCVA